MPGVELTPQQFAQQVGNHPSAYPLLILSDFIEQSNVADAVDIMAFNKDAPALSDTPYGGLSNWIDGIPGDPEHPGISTAMRGNYPFALCPSDPGGFEEGLGTGAHHATVVAQMGTVVLGTPDISLTNYVICFGSKAVSRGARGSLTGLYGPIRCRESDAIAEIRDGSSNTLLYGESLGIKVPELNNGVGIDRRPSLAMGGGCAGDPGDFFRGGGVTLPIETVFGSSDRSYNIQFGSGHPGGVNFVRGDSSVIFFSRDIDRSVIRALSGSADGSVVPSF